MAGARALNRTGEGASRSRSPAPPANGSHPAIDRSKGVVRPALFVVLIVAAVAGALEQNFPLRLADYDWAFHIGVFFVLTVIGYGSGWPIGKTIAVIMGTGIGIEFAQSLIPSRSASVRDVGMNCVGIAFGVAAAMTWARIKSLMTMRRSERSQPVDGDRRPLVTKGRPGTDHTRIREPLSR